MTHKANKTAQLNVLSIAGSLKKHSINRDLLFAMKKMAPTRMKFSVYDALEDVPLFNEDLEAQSPNLPRGVENLVEAISKADGVIISTPEYNQSIPGVLKNALDWVSRKEALDNKPVAMLGATPGQWGTRYAQAALRHTLTANGALVMGQPGVFIAGATQQSDEDTKERLQDLVLAFENWIDLVR